MCVVVLAFGVSKDVPLAIAANRDEYFARPAAPASWWRHEGVDIFGGRDLEKGGTWLGVTRAARFALVTNVRDMSLPQTGTSRGWLVRDALVSARLPPMFAYEALPAYNLLVGEGNELHYLRDGQPPQRIEPGYHAMSNHRLGTRWPKVDSVLRGMREARLDDVEALFRVLSDDVPAPDASLPSTGVPLELERLLSPPFVKIPAMGYGTRCSTVVVHRADGTTTFEERTFDGNGARTGTVRETIG